MSDKSFKHDKLIAITGKLVVSACLEYGCYPSEVYSKSKKPNVQNARAFVVDTLDQIAGWHSTSTPTRATEKDVVFIGEPGFEDCIPLPTKLMGIMFNLERTSITHLRNRIRNAHRN